MNQELILDFIKNNQNQAFNLIYNKYYGLVENHVLRNSGNKDDAQDLFQEVMIVLIGKLDNDDFMLTAKVNTYIMAISKNLWYKRLRDQKIIVDIDNYENIDSHEVDWFIENEKSNTEKILSVLDGISDHCNRLINDIFFKSTPIKEIQKLYGYSSKHNAQNQKHKCIQQMRKEKVKIFG